MFLLICNFPVSVFLIAHEIILLKQISINTIFLISRKPSPFDTCTNFGFILSSDYSAGIGIGVF